ncbi:hypothetical protein [Caldivirga maquilingensis]|uniref:Conserved repeat domain n=1 Tax=Caldivirga maquilingensis (strain ATCC 700844 / DSM 13496 / JCM 10307 / IC-167) TaxID=397948 RepID=A8MCV0_CALMQ|nr:hypothetical protein [Caldivirga maquilingensis]ABW01606.1 conserved repeat domain [Caldivirga maquilingensis IC-167]
MNPLSKTSVSEVKLTTIMVAVSLLALVGFLKVTYAQNTPPPFVILNEQATPSLTPVGVSKLTLTVEYTGGYYLYDVYFQLQPTLSCGNYTVSPGSIFIDWISPQQELTLTYLINGSLPINCQANLNVNWGGESKYSQLTSSYVNAGGSGSTSITLPIVIYGEPNIDINVNQGYLIYGSINPITLTVTNNGSGPIYNMAISIQANGAYLSPSGVSTVINYLNPGESLPLMINVVPTSTASVTLTITYSGITQSGDSVSGSSTISMSTLSVSASQVTVYPLNSTLSPGPGILEIGVRNLNPVTLYNVTIQLVSTQGLILRGNSTIMVSSIPSGGYLTLTVPVVVPLSATTASISYVLSFQLPNGYVSSGEGSLTLSIYGVANPLSVLLLNSTISPGLGELTLRVLNSASVTLYNVSLVFNSAGGLSLGGSEYNIPELPPGGSYYISVPVMTPSTTGTATISYTLYYYLTPSTYGGSITGSLPVNVISPQSILTVYPLNSTIGIGNETIPIVIRNNLGSSLSNVTFTITSAQGAYPLVTSFNIGEIQPYSARMVTVPLMVPLSAGSVVINYVLTYGVGKYVSNVNGELNLGVSSAPSVIAVVYPLNSTLNAGLGKLILGIRNNEPVPLYNLTLIFNSVNGMSITNTEYHINEVGAGGTYYLTVPAAIPSSSSSVSLSYTLMYSYAGGEGNVEGQITMSVAGLPQILITGYTIAPTVATVGTDVSISLTLVNSGPVTANNLNVTMLTSPGLEAISGRSIYLGSLGSQSLSNVAFTVLPVRPLNGSIIFIITFTDQYGQLHRIYYSVPIRVFGNSTRFAGFPGSNSSGRFFTRVFTTTASRVSGSRYGLVTYITIAVVVIIVVAVVVLALRRRGGGSEGH